MPKLLIIFVKKLMFLHRQFPFDNFFRTGFNSCKFGLQFIFWLLFPDFIFKKVYQGLFSLHCGKEAGFWLFKNFLDDWGLFFKGHVGFTSFFHLNFQFFMFTLDQMLGLSQQYLLFLMMMIVVLLFLNILSKLPFDIFKFFSELFFEGAVTIWRCLFSFSLGNFF